MDTAMLLATVVLSSTVHRLAMISLCIPSYPTHHSLTALCGDMRWSTILLFLLPTILKLLQIKAEIRSKKLKLLSMNMDTWMSSQEVPEARSLELCRNACVGLKEQCRAYFFNETSKVCEIGDESVGSIDPIILPTDKGKYVYGERGFSPEPYQHLALLGGSRRLSLDFSFKSNTSIAPWFEPWNYAGSQWHTVGMYYKKGFFLCGTTTALDSVCEYQELGTDTWLTQPSMPVPVVWMTSFQYDDETLWVVGGMTIDNAGAVSTSSTDMIQVFTEGAWTYGPHLQLPEIRSQACVARLSDVEVAVIAGGTIAGQAPARTTYIHNAKSQQWTQEQLVPQSGDSPICGSFTLPSGTTLVVLVGGVIASSPTTQVYIFNGDTRQWSLSTKVFPVMTCCGGANSFRNTLFVYGGRDIDHVYEFEPDTEDWRAVGTWQSPNDDTNYSHAIFYNF